MDRPLSCLPEEQEIRTHRVLFSLDEPEKEVFFPGADWSGRLLPGHEWAVFKGDSELSWSETLESFRPSVIVSCWSTPALAPDWVADPGCSLQYVCHVAGSVRHVVPREFLVRGGMVTNWGGAPSSEVAEHALLLALSALRNAGSWWAFIDSREKVASHQSVALRTRTLIGKQVGIHGFGRIARALVGFLKPFGVTIRCYSHGVPPSAMAAFGVEPCDDLTTLFRLSDVMFECEALTPHTAGSVTREILGLLPREAIFVNVGRGCVVDEDALARLAASGSIRVAIDVVTHEPVQPDTKFRAIDGVILSPHIGGPTFEKFPECGNLAMQNLRRFLSGASLPDAMSLDEYDRST